MRQMPDFRLYQGGVMSVRKDFDKFLSSKEKEHGADNQFDWDKQKREWLEYLEELFHRFEGALKEYQQSKKVKIAYDEIDIAEDYIGNYKARTMTIEFAGEMIVLKPIGTNLIGAKGRVDMYGRNGSAKIVLVDSRMKSMRDHVKVSVYVGEMTQKEEPKTQKEAIKWEWKFISAPPTRLYQPVNDETIYSAIMELSNG